MSEYITNTREALTHIGYLPMFFLLVIFVIASEENHPWIVRVFGLMAATVCAVGIGLKMTL